MAKSRKTILITGSVVPATCRFWERKLRPIRRYLFYRCSRGGIGDALARRFHEAGFDVFATARSLNSMEHLASVGIRTMALDVTDIQALRKVKANISEITGGKLDILVNNAGLAYPVAATDFDMSEVRPLFEASLFAVMTMVQEFVNLLIASGDACIVQTGSVSGFTPVPFSSAAYNASKAALHAYGNTIRVELAPFQLAYADAVQIITGAVKSNIAKPRSLPSNSLYRPMEKLYQERHLNTSQQNATDTDVYAHEVVSEVLKPNPRAWFWAGARTMSAWVVDTFLPRRTFVSVPLVALMFNDAGTHYVPGLDHE
ncbi:NAD-P-binding protein [Rhodofomes roseus]|uniref:NAD-P-binding protein n=1 Tax=Rhodofomes roseus TaxID=34475 RepID=A0ABQ8KAW3_9APHY|nr:NAD-P-binding protein [Rhodofomes roseus]KAH9834522.1 NAD-P-binding protein [Rhodofomes roseus]